MNSKELRLLRLKLAQLKVVERNLKRWERSKYNLEKFEELKQELTKDITKLVENLLEGKVIDGKKITFVMSGYTKSWRIYSFSPKTNNINNVLGVVLGEKTDKGPRFHAVFCNLDNKKVFYNDKKLV